MPLQPAAAISRSAQARQAVNLDGWTLRDQDGHTYTFEDCRLAGRATVRIYTGVGLDTCTDLHQDRRNYVWDNRSDTATLRNDRGRFIDEVSWGYDRHHHGDNRRHHHRVEAERHTAPPAPGDPTRRARPETRRAAVTTATAGPARVPEPGQQQPRRVPARPTLILVGAPSTGVASRAAGRACGHVLDSARADAHYRRGRPGPARWVGGRAEVGRLPCSARRARRGRVLLHSSRRAVTRTRGTSDSARVNSRTPADARVSPGLPRFRGSRRSRAGQRVADPERRP